MRREVIKKINNAEKDFFDIDTDNKVAKVPLHFETVDDIFDSAFLVKTPVFNDDFNGFLESIIGLVPPQYKIALDISFDSTGDYTTEELREIFRRNLELKARSFKESIRNSNHLAYALIAAGFLTFVAMMVIGRLWNAENFWHDVFFYFLDITTTVLFWEAAGILFVENREKRRGVKSYIDRFESISFN